MKSKTKIIQISNIAPQATKDQLSSLFSYLGKIEDIKLFPTIRDVAIPVQSRICFIKFNDRETVGVAQHLTNIVFIDRALLVIPYLPGELPDETRAIDLLNSTSIFPGLSQEVPWPDEVKNEIDGIVLKTTDPKLENCGLPSYPNLPATVESHKVNEIRRTLVFDNLPPSTTIEQLEEFANEGGAVKYLRLGSDEDNLGVINGLVEYCEQKSIPSALRLHGKLLNGNHINVNHSTLAIVKPVSKSNEAAVREIEEAMLRVKQAQTILTASIDPLSAAVDAAASSAVNDMSSKSRSMSRLRTRSPSRRRSRSKSRSRRRRSRSRSRRRSKSRTKRRSRSRSRSKRSRSKRKSRSRSRKRSRSRSPRSSKSSRRDRDRKKSKERDRRDKEKRKSKDREEQKDKKPDVVKLDPIHEKEEEISNGTPAEKEVNREGEEEQEVNKEVEEKEEEEEEAKDDVSKRDDDKSSVKEEKSSSRKSRSSSPRRRKSRSRSRSRDRKKKKRSRSRERKRSRSRRRSSSRRRRSKSKDRRSRSRDRKDRDRKERDRRDRRSRDKDRRDRDRESKDRRDRDSKERKEKKDRKKERRDKEEDKEDKKEAIVARNYDEEEMGYEKDEAKREEKASVDMDISP